MFSNKRNMNFNFFTVSTFNQCWMSGYYKMMKHHLREWKHREVDLVVLKLTFCFRKLEGTIDESVINSPQSQFTTERNGEMKFKIFLGNAQFQSAGIVHCPPFNFFNISLLPSRNLFKKKLCSFAYNSSD